MPSTYSSRLRFELIADGEQSGTWGQTTNRNTGTLVETAIAGYRTIALADANYTLTTSNGLDDDARYAMLNFTGTLTATREVIAPAVSKLYVVKNQTNQTLNVKTAAGAARAVPAGKTVMVFIDGTDAFDILNDLTSLSVSGTTALGTASATNLSYTGTLTGGTGVVNIGSGQIYKAADGDVGFGTSTPAHRIHAVSALSTSIVAEQTSGTPADIQIAASSGGAGIVGTIGNYPLVFRTNSTECMRLDGNNLGVGTSSPQFRTDFNVTSTLTNDQQVALRLKSTTTADMVDGFGVTQLFSIQDNAGANRNIAQFRAIRDGADDSGAIVLAPYSAGAATERLRLNAAGNMGLGVTPSAWGAAFKSLDMNTYGAVGSTTALVRLSANAYDTGANNIYKLTAAAASLYQQTLGAHQFFTAPSGTAGNPITFTQAMTLTNGGNLLVGATTDRGAKLYLNNDVSATAADANKILLFGTNVTTSADAYGFGVSASQLNYKCGTGASHVFHVATSERARITSGGYFKASNTGSYGGVAGLGDLAASSNHIFQHNAAGSCVVSLNGNTGAAAVGFNSFLATGAAGNHYEARVNNVEVYRVEADGDVRNTNNSYGAISDAKLKENVTDASSYLDRFMQVRFRNFNFIGSDLKQFGVIAQELEQVFPGLVDSTPDVDDEGNDLGTVTKSVKYSVLALMAGKVIQEQQAIITAQQAQIDSILARLTALESK